jgi:Flp pilus assembly protein TadG
MDCVIVLRRVLGAPHTFGRILAANVRRRANLKAFGADTRGSVAIIFGLTILVLFAMIGMAVDYARFVNARTQTIEATDAAVLAGARALQSNGGDQTAAVKVAETYYQQATKNRMKLVANSDTIDFAVTDNGTAMITKGNAQIATPFMNVAFLGSTKAQSLPLLHSNGSDYSKAVLAVGGNGQNNLEISMMLDISGSMGTGTKMQDMKDAANSLVDIVVWADQSQYTSRVAIVPFSAEVLPTSSLFKYATGQATGSASPSTQTESVTTGSGKNQKTTNYTYKPTTCVAERGGQDYSDTAPSNGHYVLREYTTNGSCGISSKGVVQPMTSDKTALHSLINSLVDGGNTAGHVGTAWAAYMLSPKWAPGLPTASQPTAYGTAKVNKIAVLMTDGAYNQEHDSKGVATGQNGAGASVNSISSAEQAKQVCTSMKNNGIEVYTVGFNLDGNSASDEALAIDTLSKCATDANHFYNSSTGDALKSAFQNIALKISTLYLSQ